MNAAAWAAVAACASTVSASVAFVAIWFTGRQALAQVRVADFNNCLEVVKQLSEAQRKVFAAPDEKIHGFEFHELLNLMEALALLINDRRMAPSSRKYAGHFLKEAIAWMSVDPDMRTLLERSITGAETFSELIAFQKAHVHEVENLIVAYSSDTRAQRQLTRQDAARTALAQPPS